VEFMAQLLKKLRMLLIFENFESLLDCSASPSAITDPSVAAGLQILVGQAGEEARFIFTSRCGVDPGGDIPGESIEHIEVEARPDAPDVLEQVASVYDSLSDESKSVLAAVAVFHKPFPLGDGDIGEQIKALEAAGLIERSGEAVRAPLYVRDFIVGRTEPEKWREFLVRAAQSLEAHARKSQALWHMVNARTLYLEAGEYGQAGDIVLKITEALRYLGVVEQAVQLNVQTADTTDGITCASAYHNLGSLLSSQGRDKQALEYYDKSLELKTSLGLKAEAAFTLGQVGNLHYQRGDIENARRAYEECLALSNECGETASAAASLHQLGLLDKASGNSKEAMEKFSRSLELNQEAGNRQGEASALSQMGVLYQGMGQLEEAQQNLGRALDIFEDLNDEAGIARARHMLGNLAYQARQFDKALGQYDQSLKLRSKLRDSHGVAGTLLNIGMAHQSLGQPQEAQQAYGQCIEIFEQLKDHQGLSSALQQSGIVHQQQKEYDQALEKVNRSLKLRDGMGDRHGAAQSIAQLGTIYLEKGDNQTALRNLFIAMSIFESLGSPYRDFVAEDIDRMKASMGDEEFQKLQDDVMAEM
jgi:tetratricopeptide (TPR) repeat protein